MISYDGKHFNTKKELFKFLKENKQFIIDKKKSVIKYANPVTCEPARATQKAASGASTMKDTDDVLYRTLVVNTYHWLDSHGDVHMKGTFTKSIKERALRIQPFDQHKYSLDYRIGKTLSIEEKVMEWKDLGVELEGDTISVVTLTEIHRAKSPARFADYKNGDIDQHSVGMMYVNLTLCIDDEDYEEEKTAFDKYINMVGNKEEAIQQGYFFAIHEAKLIEYSCVIEGSNSLTPVIQPDLSTEQESKTVLLNAELLLNKVKLLNIQN